MYYIHSRSRPRKTRVCEGPLTLGVNCFVYRVVGSLESIHMGSFREFMGSFIHVILSSLVCF